MHYGPNICTLKAMNTNAGEFLDSLESLDALGRPLKDLRISVTDKCNFRCPYCMPKEIFGANYKYLSKQSTLTSEEVIRSATIFRSLGISKIRITGGEPTLRMDLLEIIQGINSIGGIDIAMTTNGSLLTTLAQDLRRAGLGRLTVSLDAVDDTTFSKMSDVSISLDKVLDGLESARKAGFQPVKINTVIRRGWNENTILDLVDYCRKSGDIVRFIEFMDVGSTNNWEMSEIIASSQLLETIQGMYPLEAVSPNYMGEVASRYKFSDGKGELGFISSVSQPFCSSCTRARISADGKIYTCLFAVGSSLDLAHELRNGCTNEEISEKILALWEKRDDRYSELRSSGPTKFTNDEKIEMSYIGG